MRQNTNTEAFFALLRAGLWEKKTRLSEFGTIDYSVVYRLAEEQSIVGLVAAGLEHVADVKVPQNAALVFAGAALQLEQRNKAMNLFIEDLLAKLRSKKLYALLMKGQGIAQCYERPLWRSAGDIDILLGVKDYETAKQLFSTVGEICEEENIYKKHVEFLVGQWDIELHGSMRSELNGRIDKVIDDVQKDVFYGGNVRLWMNGNTSVFMPAPDNDVIFVFVHILQHFFRGGIGLRQICDWCRLLWTYKDSLNHVLLESRIRKMGVMTEWKAFGTLAVKVLGMPNEAMPLYSEKKVYARKAQKLCDIVMASGNFGYNRDLSYKAKSSFFLRMVISLYYRTYDFVNQVKVFPLDSCRAYFGVLKTGFRVVYRKVR